MLEDAVIKGKRLAAIRTQLASSRLQFEKKYGISANTLRYWEKPDEKHSAGLTEKGAKTIVTIARNEGIDCSVNWLMHGTYGKPIDKNHISKNQSPITYHEIRGDVFELFSKYDSLSSYTINNDLMAPQYEPDDIVAGISLANDKFDLAIRRDCIVTTEDDEIIFGRVTEGTSLNFYNVLSTNINARSKPQTHTDIILLSVAPVLFILKKPNF